ncbi:hypothetical protein LWI28_002433 [Acer negundo]|uniref:CNNM transmembrane domain-containing protein n=1 Tax=Acer negundo TaxID=4023 RepID=A0AAD5IBQ2_ACENE|nr:hypothetical protein LWI28_002433 [Acer negundo]
MAANDVPCCEPMFWVYLIICVALVSFAGLMSGLTLGLMSLSLVDLEVLMKAGSPQDRKNAAKILPIVKNQHLLLCTLLIGNAMAMEALPIFVDALLPAWGAILISVTLILAFGEIIPQAVCSRYGLSVGAKLSVLVRLIVIVVFPISYPISKLLDLLLGKRHSALLRRAELKTLVDMHGNEAGKGGELTHDETTIITGALDMTQKTAKDAMTPLSNVFSIDINSRLDEYVKNLIKYSPGDKTPMRDLTIRRIPRVHDHLPLYDILNQFQKGHSHMAVVVKCKNDVNKETAEITTAKAKSNTFEISIQSNPKPEIKEENGGNDSNSNTCLKKWEQQNGYVSKEELETLPSNLDEEIIGIITLEDVMEELLQEEILDETDEYVDVHNKIKINMLPSHRSSSPGAAFASRQWSPLSSYNRTPLSSCNYTPVLRSPVSPYIQSPFIRPTLSASPGKAMSNSPAKFSGTAVYSPSSQRVT